MVVGCGRTQVDELLAAARSEDAEQRQLALRQIAELSAEGAPAIPVLIELSHHRDPQVRRLCGLALGNIAPRIPATEEWTPQTEVVPALETQLIDSERAVQTTAAFALLNLNPDHAAAQQQLNAAMRQGDGGIIDRMKRLQPAPEWAIPTLFDLLQTDRRPGIRRLSAEALGMIAPDDLDVHAALRSALNDKDDRVQEAAKDALSPRDQTPQ